jgi:omega-6 fatty acid desaturase (delta-12 desaturase)
MEQIPELQKVKTTSLHPFEIWACLKLKVWHPERNEMISL